jgi:hypothetical protein
MVKWGSRNIRRLTLSGGDWTASRRKSGFVVHICSSRAAAAVAASRSRSVSDIPSRGGGEGGRTGQKSRIRALSSKQKRAPVL